MRVRPPRGETNAAEAMHETRIAYVKAGDAARELQDYGPAALDGRSAEDGPATYPGSFLRLCASCRTLLLSTGRRRASFDLGSCEARTLPYHASRPLRPLRLLEALLRLLQFRPGAVICPLIGPPLWTARLAARLTGARFILSRHNLHQNARTTAFGKFSSWLDARIFRKADAVLCHGEFLRRELMDLGVAAERVRPFTVGFREFSELAPEPVPSLAGLPPFVLFVGRMTGEKGVFDLLDAFAGLAAAFPDAHLVYAGTGPAMEELKARIAGAGLENRVHLPGALSRAQLAWATGACLFAATPTRSSFPEGRCKVLGEAFVLGKTVLAPDFGPFSFYLRHGENAELHAPDDPQALARGLRRLLGDPEYRAQLEQGARAEAENLLDPKATFEEQLGAALSSLLPGAELTPPAQRPPAAPVKATDRQTKDRT